MSAPAAELTMLFTDIEGSTRLLNRLGPAYADVLSVQRRILRAAFERAGGREMGTEGDSFFVVFESAADAVSAAVEAQQGLEAGTWPADVPVRVRMGLHTGHPQPFEDGLVGIDVHLAARVSATAYGGQVVLTEATSNRVAGHLPAGTSLMDLGVHRLKDIPEPQHLCQLVVPGLPPTFPPLRSLGAPGSLPVAPTALVGRAADVAALHDLLSPGGVRLVTLTGPGGTGKTRLALAAAEELAPAFPGGVHFVDLTSAAEPSVVWTTLAETVGRSGDTEAGVLEHLRDREVLLLLDNLEQLPDAGAGVVRRLLAATGRLRLLATSRRPLRVAGEQEYPVAPLGLPDPGPRSLTVEAAGRADAVSLFVQQARLTDPGFALSDDNVTDVVALCRRLDGLPLALELAAARVRLLPPRALLDHLDEAVGLPLPGHPERQQTLVATVDWSYRMVEAAERRAFRALAVFGTAGGTFDALAAVLEAPSALAMVSGLLDAALVRVDDHPAGPRVRLLHTVALVARRLAERDGELESLQQRHAAYYLGLAEHAGERLRGPDAMTARGQIELEMDNLRAALDWSLGGGHDDGLDDVHDDVHDDGRGEDGRAATGIRLCTALGWFWYLTGYDAESRRWLERASRAAAEHQGPQLAKLLHSFALLLLQQGDLGTARDLLGKSLLLWRRAGDRHGEATVLNSLGIAYRALGDPQRARAMLEDSIEVAVAIEDRQRQATSLTNLALLEIDTGRPDAALPLLAEAERLDRARGDAWGVATDRVNVAAALLASGRIGEAGEVVHELGASIADHGDPDLNLDVIELGAVAASLVGDHASAVTLAACADEQRRVNRMPLSAPDRAFLDQRLDVSRRALAEAAPECERTGRELSVAAALAEVAVLPIR